MHFLIVDDHPLYREALRDTVLLAYPSAVVEEASSISAACELAQELSRHIDLVLLDLMMCDVSGFDGLVILRKRLPALPILVVSGLDEPANMAGALRYGAAGFIPKSADKITLTGAIAAVLRGELAFLRSSRRSAHPGDVTADSADLAARIGQLTPQQLRVLVMIRQGKLNKQIAHELSVGNSTVKAHVSAILRKLGVNSRTQIVIETAGLNFNRPD